MMCQAIPWRSPAAAFAPLAGMTHAHMLHAGDLNDADGWSIIAAFPVDIITAREGQDACPFARLQTMMAARALPINGEHKALPFMSGVLGYVGYEAARYLDRDFELHHSPYALPDLCFGVYDAAILLSRNKQDAYAVGRNKGAVENLLKAIGAEELSSATLPRFHSMASNKSYTDYISIIKDVRMNIVDGHYYQANIAQCLSAQSDDTIRGFDVFRLLAGRSDARFGALLQFDEGDVISNSPERFFSIDHDESCRRIAVEPIKGTRPRRDDPREDSAMRTALSLDAKDRAENIMIVDLMRNDLSKICCDHTIVEDAICELMSLKNVHHLVSKVGGALRNDATIKTVFEALFPCGSITGAPKAAAMEAIAGFEGTGRGPYCGAIGYWDDRGCADFSVAIRTMMTNKNRNQLSIPVGGGITLRSEPTSEYEETLAKAKAAMTLLDLHGDDLL